MKINYSSRKFAAWGCGAVATLLASGAAAQTFTRINTGPLATAPALESHSSAWADLENDGDLDVFVANTLGNNALYRNDGNGNFTAITSSPATTDGGATTGGAWGDFDNDGLLDVFFVNRWQDHFLYRGTGGFGFSKVTGSPATAGGLEAYHASWVDYDNDGFLDLYVVNVSTLAPPFPNVNYLYRNNGNGTFTRNTNSSIANLSGAWAGCAWGDYNGDGRQDVVLVKAGGNALFRNDGNGAFTQLPSSPVATDGGIGSAATWGDYDNDGDLDLFVANRQGVNALYRNNSGALTRVTNGGAITTDVADSNGAMWGDYDNDGWLDLYVTNGDLPPNQQNFLYRNDRNGTFSRVTTGPHVTDSEQSLSAVWVDYDNDGSLDLFVTNAGTNSLYRSSGAAANWLKVRLVGQISNRSAIGAKVRVTATINGVQRTLLRHVSGEGGFHGQNLEQHFGLGNAIIVNELRVDWPSGAVTTLNSILADQRVEVQESNPGFTHVIPTGYQNVDGNYYAGTLYANEMRHQVVYSSANFPGGSITISEIRFRRDINEPAFTNVNASVLLRLSTTARNPGGLSTTFAQNSGPDETVVYNGPWTFASPTVVPNGTVRPFEIRLPLTTPFTYDPTDGNLLFDLRISGIASGNWTDGVNGSQLSRAEAPYNASATAGALEGTGDVLQLLYQPSNELVFSPPTGTFTNSVQVSIQSGYPNSVIRYTTDGNDPTVSSTTYTGPFTLTQTTTVKARLFVNGFPASEIASGTYTRYAPPDIAFNPPGQLFTNQLSVTLVNNVGSDPIRIRYTLDGTPPTSTSPLYTGPLNLTNGTTVRAQVFLNTFAVSAVFAETYARVYCFANDGVPFAWREQYFGPNFLTNPCAAVGADCDDDGYVVAEEYQSATDPTDGNSAPEILLSVRAVPRLTFATIAGRSYRIQRTTTLNPPNWQTIVESVLATGPELHYVDEEAPDNSYYQVELIRN